MTADTTPHHDKPATVHIGHIREAAEQMREVTTTRTGLILPPPVAQTLTGWLDQIADSEQDYYTSTTPNQVDDPQPLDAAHGAWTIAQAWLAAGAPAVESATDAASTVAGADRGAAGGVR